MNAYVFIANTYHRKSSYQKCARSQTFVHLSVCVCVALEAKGTEELGDFVPVEEGTCLTFQPLYLRRAWDGMI